MSTHVYAPGSARWRTTRALLAMLAVAALMLVPTGRTEVAQAGRFGLPWQAEITRDRVDVHAQADPAAPVVATLSRGQVVAALDVERGADGVRWFAVGGGYVPAAALDERVDPWVARVAWDT